MLYRTSVHQLFFSFYRIISKRLTRSCKPGVFYKKLFLERFFTVNIAIYYEIFQSSFFYRTPPVAISICLLVVVIPGGVIVTWFTKSLSKDGRSLIIVQ